MMSETEEILDTIEELEGVVKKFRGELQETKTFRARAEELCRAVEDALNFIKDREEVRRGVEDDLVRDFEIGDIKFEFPEEERAAVRNLLLEVLDGPDVFLRKRIQNLCDLLPYRSPSDGFLRIAVLL